MNELPSGVDSDTMKWAIAMYFVDRYFVTSSECSEISTSKERLAKIAENVRGIYWYLSEQKPASGIENPFDM